MLQLSCASRALQLLSPKIQTTLKSTSHGCVCHTIHVHSPCCGCSHVLQGGLTWLWLDAPYVITARKLFNWAVESNNKGDVFPVSHLQAKLCGQETSQSHILYRQLAADCATPAVTSHCQLRNSSSMHIPDWASHPMFHAVTSIWIMVVILIPPCMVVLHLLSCRSTAPASASSCCISWCPMFRATTCSLRPTVWHTHQHSSGQARRRTAGCSRTCRYVLPAAI